MAYGPFVYRRPTRPPRVGRIARPAPPPRGARRFGLGELGANIAAQTVATTAVSAIPVVGPILSSFVGPVIGILDPGAKVDAARKQRVDGIAKLAGEGSLLAARQLLGGAEGGAVGAAKEKAWYVAAWAAFQQQHPDIAAAARAAGAAGVGPDPGKTGGWNPPPADVAQYSKDIQAYQQFGTAGLAAQAATARASSLPGGPLGIVIGAGLLFAFMRRR